MTFTRPLPRLVKLELERGLPAFIEARRLDLLVDDDDIYLTINSQRTWQERRPIETNRGIIGLHRSFPRSTVVLRG